MADSKEQAANSRVRTALGCLIVGTAISGCTPSSSGFAGKLTVADVAVPDNPILDLTGKQWKEVTIELTEDQKAELKKRGVDTKVIKITTFDLTRLGTASNN